MQVMTAKQAKNNFGELTNSMFREPVFITKNNRPIGAFVSMEDLQGTAIAERYANEHDDWVFNQLNATMNRIETEGFKGTPLNADLKEKVMAKLRSHITHNDEA